MGGTYEPKETRTKYLAIHYSYGLAIITSKYNFMEVKK
jgi:hypothetical protein